MLEAYDNLLAQSGSPVVALNRGIAVAKVHGVAVGIDELLRLRGSRALDTYPCCRRPLGALHAELGNPERAAACYREALAKTASGPERRLLAKRFSHLAPG